jgi:hypothetical protein
MLGSVLFTEEFTPFIWFEVTADSELKVVVRPVAAVWYFTMPLPM